MNKVTTKAMAKVAAVATGLAMATSMLSLAPMAHAAALTSAQVQSILSLLSSFGADSSTIANVQASLTGGTPSSTTSGSTTTTTGTCSFTKDLTMKSTGAEVTSLQQALINGGYSIPAGATGYFGAQTRTAVIAWQTAKGVTPAAGYFGPKSRAAFTLSCSSSSTTTTTTTTTTTAGTGTGLKVSLSPTSPNGTVLVAGQGIGDLGDFVFANPTSAPINVTALSFNRTGVSNDSTMTNVYLYKGATRITDSASVNNSSFTYSDPTALFTVPAGATYTVSVRSDIALLNSSGSQIGVNLVSATSNGTLDSSVSFPVVGGLQTISSASLATVSFSSNVTPTGSGTPATLTISAQNDYPVWQDSITVSTNPVKLSSMRFTNLGSADSSSIVNLRLYVDGVQVGSAIPVMGADRSATFDFSSAPVLLSTSTHVVKVLANITNTAAGRTVQFSVQRSSDGMFIDSQLNQPVVLTTGSSNFTTASTGTINIQSASAGVSVSTDPSSPNQNVAAGASNVKWASFDMLASGENVKVSDLYVYADTAATAGAAASGLNNGKIMVNGVQVGSTHDLVEGDGASVVRGSATDFSLGSSLILPAGQTTVVDVYADAQFVDGSNLTNSSSVTVYLAAGSSNGQGVSSYTTTSVPAANVPGNAIVVSNSSLSAAKSTSYGDQTVVAGSNNAKLGSFALSTGSTGSVSVNTIEITFVNAVSASVTNLTLKDSATGTILGSVITTPSTDNSFSVSLTIPASSSKTIDIYGNILSGAGSTSIQAKVGTGTTGTDSSGQSASVTGVVALQTITIGAGTLTASNGAGDPVSNNILAGASSVNVGEFNFAAQNSSYTVQNLAILVPVGQARDVTNVTLSYKDVNGATKTATQALVNGASGYATATFQGLTMYVPANDSANVDVSVGTPTIAANAISGDGIKVSLDTGITSSTFRAVNSAGTATTKINSGVNVAAGGTFYVRKSIPTFAMVPTGSTVPSTGQPLYKFSITADPAGAIEWTHLTFNIATSGTSNPTITNL
ncbi:MAG: beta strand repeat-containing protein, partial [Minisyncoccota bacterium]